MMQRIKNFVVNAGLVGGSVLIGLLFCELVLFRMILLPSDVPANAFIDGLVRYAPDQAGVWRVRDEIAAPYAINKQGWNSGTGDYIVARRPGIDRVAIVGDSMVEALQVAHGQSIGERLAAELSHGGNPVEVYRFAVSGAPLSQYLNMIEHEVVRYRPDWIVVLLIHNDFDETYRFVGGRYTSSFLKLRVVDGAVIGEVPAEPWHANAGDWARRTATARYLYYRWQVRPDAIRRLLLRSERPGERYEANIDVHDVLGQLSDIAAATGHVFARLAAFGRGEGTRFLLAMDGVRTAIYAGNTSQALELNRLAADIARKQGLPFVDLHSAFAEDWSINKKRFEYSFDNHWNEYGHIVAARAVARAIREQR
jgi:lysophospholipase L1-like esterase